jgi:SAM-dependent methyltransferase
MNTQVLDPKWLIPPYTDAPSLQKEIATWNEDHHNYSQKIFSLTQDPKICSRLIHSSDNCIFNIPNSPEINILIPGCGSEIYLQEKILEFCPHIAKIYSTDFSEVAIQECIKKWQSIYAEIDRENQQFIFLEADSTKLTEDRSDWKNKFDYIIIVNSVLSGDDITNRQMLREFHDVLKPGGKLYGFFPTIFCDLEIAHLSKENARWLTDGTVNLEHSAVYDKRYQDRQIFYTPLRLNRIFKEIGFKQLSFEVIFCDSDILVESSKKTDGVDEPDVYQWEFLVRLEKRDLYL